MGNGQRLKLDASLSSTTYFFFLKLNNCVDTKKRELRVMDVIKKLKNV
jgi:hypothetical protein